MHKSTYMKNANHLPVNFYHVTIHVLRSKSLISFWNDNQKEKVHGHILYILYENSGMQLHILTPFRWSPSRWIVDNTQIDAMYFVIHFADKRKIDQLPAATSLTARIFMW